MSGEYDPVFIQARRALLDALEALAEHREAVILVGAQAVYLHTEQTDFDVEPYTTDADLAINPAALAPDPKLDALLQAAGFHAAPDAALIGRWLAPDGIPIDLMVPEAVSGGGRRGARLGAHGNRVARKARGLEAALVDNSLVTITAYDASDPRSIEVAVAGPAALLVAKLHKLADRQESETRLHDKDAHDIYRLLQAVSTAELGTRLQTLLHDSRSQAVTDEAITMLRNLFGTPVAAGSQMAARAVELSGDPMTVAAACAALTDDLLECLPSNTV
jgi:predicted nucleotidyltransferase